MSYINEQKPDYEHVVLVDEGDQVIGTASKAEVHTQETPLHRAFSVFLFHTETKQLLLQQRALTKHTWPGIWSNSCCGHPELGEDRIIAARRRLEFELGISHLDVLEYTTPYRYCFERDGVVENEICPVYIALSSDNPKPHPDEVEATRWVTWEEFMEQAFADENTFSEWCREEAQLIEQTEIFQNIVK